MPIITFMPSGATIEVMPGEFLLEAALHAGLPVQQQCGNVAVCGWCRMTILEGSEYLSMQERPEILLAEREHFSDNERASCQTQVFGNVRVSTPYW